VKRGVVRERATCYERWKVSEILWDLSGLFNILPLLLYIISSGLHYACKGIRREHRHKLVVRRTRVVTTHGIAAFQGKIFGGRTHIPRTPWNHKYNRLQNTFPMPLDPMHDDRHIRGQLKLRGIAIRSTVSMLFLLSAGRLHPPYRLLPALEFS
jgi:hypothetical protein